MAGSSAVITPLERERIARQLALPGFDLEQQERLSAARVLIVGAGGLGCPVIQQLAAAGVGAIEIWDDDTVDISNIHRQILFGADDVGKPKATLAAERARKLQPDCASVGVVERLTPANVIAAVQQVDLVIDGSDNFATKYLVADACEITATPLVWGTVLRFHGDVALWHSGPKTRGVGLRDLFPQQLPMDAVPDCAEAGVLGATTSVIGGLMATAAIGWLSGLSRQVGVVTSYDAFPPVFRSLHVSADPQRSVTTRLGNYGFEDVEQVCEAISLGATVIDIREYHEGPSPADTLRFPMSEIKSFSDLRQAAPQSDSIVVLCAAGVRSAQVVEKFASSAREAGICLQSFPGGLDEWERRMK
ncbi:MAG: ThiF family adenylyltransferase [Corynebacterium sp.]|nr:ThiF family adenylyltransferase [Corynebacterium sp.]